MEKWLRQKVIHNDAKAKEMADQLEECGFTLARAKDMFEWARKHIHDDKKALDLVLEFNETNISDDYAKNQFAWARKLIHNDEKALDLVRKTHELGFTCARAKDMFAWARKVIPSDEKALDLMFEFDQTNVPDHYVKNQFDWARKIIHNNEGALDLVRKTHGHPFGPMPLWYTRDLFKFARSKTGADDVALDLIFEWYGTVEIGDGNGFMIWWQLPSFEELAHDIPTFFAEIRKHCYNDKIALEKTGRLIKIAGRCDLAEFKSLWTQKRKEIKQDKEALEAVFVELESR